MRCVRVDRGIYHTMPRAGPIETSCNRPAPIGNRRFTCVIQHGVTPDSMGHHRRQFPEELNLQPETT